MNLYTVTAPFCRIHGGTLALTDEQARARAHALHSLGEGLFRVTAPVGFKTGECFGWDGELSKAFASQVEVLADEQTEPDPDPEPQPDPDPEPEPDPEPQPDPDPDPEPDPEPQPEPEPVPIPKAQSIPASKPKGKR